ncbi:polyisoprenyl-teichoic acid--peptidoglycan teichoic acid transferase TagU [Mesobacillus jeotgali]|uniref:polyisoprenyl-teichoic acid--peptidoglycan teichoic acid transferase TagU n=1 Tax=Mesobacillus jeotgali TaxID=129985 RepID=UPI001CFD96E0|nr:LytR family transcriptional regulator [Mesobacillus jeotgali]
MSSRIQKKSTGQKRKWQKILLLTFAILFLGIGAYVYSIYNSLTDAVETMHDPLERKKSELRQKDITLDKKEPFSVLLLGVDQRENDKGRSDTMIVLTINPKENSLKMLSIPRDTRTEIVGKGYQDKINHAYAFGGPEMSMDTVEKFLDIPIDHYVQINMEGFQDIVDAVGGVTVQNDFDFTYGGDHFNKGNIELNGSEALNYTRMRKADPRGDFGRQSRQRQVIQGVIREGASASSLTNYGDIFKALGTNIRTSLSFDQMVTIQKKYRSASNKIEQIQLKGQGSKIDGIYYYLVPNEEQKKVQDTLKKHLEL